MVRRIRFLVAALCVASGSGLADNVFAADRPAVQGGVYDKPYLKQTLEALLAGKDVPLAETKAFGCTIKWPK